MYPWRALPRTQRLAAILVLTGVMAGGVRLLAGSDHQDTPLVELNPRMDLTDVYAFPGSAPGRIVLVMNTSGFLSPGQTGSAAFDPNILYHLAVALNKNGQRQEAVKLLTPLVASNGNFTEKADAQRLLDELSKS